MHEATSSTMAVGASPLGKPRTFAYAPPLPIHAVEAYGQQDRRTYFCCKRIMDAVLAAFLLLLLLPFMLLIAILIKLDSDGPVLFVQERIGVEPVIKNRRLVWAVRTFQFYKFRSMVQNADSSLHRAYVQEFQKGRKNGNGNGVPFKLVDDSRITRLGRLLRKTSIDELPQLFNVLKGDMSLVGPRPSLVYEAAMYENAHYERFCAPPGITGLWQTKGRCQVPFEDVIRMDIEYVRTSNLWCDIKILFNTIPAVLSCRGAG